MLRWREIAYGTRLDNSEKWRPYFGVSLVPICRGAFRLHRRVLSYVPLVISDRLPGALLRADVLRDRRVPPLLLPSLIQDQPVLPVCDGSDGHDFHAKGRALVGR